MKFVIKDSVYDVLKWVQRLLLPALATLYLALGAIWKDIVPLPYPEQVAATITAVDTFLGAILGISARNYNKEQADAAENRKAAGGE